MKKSYSRPVLTIHGAAAEQTKGATVGINTDYNGEYRHRIVP